MEQKQIIAAIDKLMVELACKILRYSQCVNWKNKTKIRKRVRLQLRVIGKEIAELKKQLHGVRETHVKQVR